VADFIYTMLYTHTHTHTHTHHFYSTFITTHSEGVPGGFY